MKTAPGPRLTRGGRFRKVAPWIPLAVSFAVAGCAGSTTPLPDLTAELPPVLSPREKEAAVGALEQHKNAAADAARQIERERPK